MLATAVVLTLIITIINAANYASVVSDADRLLDILSSNAGVFPESDSMPRPQDEPGEPSGGSRMKSPEEPFETRYFTVTIDSGGNAETVDTSRIAAVSQQEARELAPKLYKNRGKSGFEGSYKYRAVTDENGTMYIFLDCGRSMESFYSFLWASAGVSATGLILVFLIVLFISKYAVAPIARSYEKQKQFITDAGHELKTPLTIIDANAEVIEMESGESEWSRSIRNQVGRLSRLTEQLITLSRLDETDGRIEKQRFSLSDAVGEAAQPFFTVAAAAGKTLTVQAEEGLSFNGSEKSVANLVSLLLDNAVKYSSDGSEIKLTLKARGRKRVLTVKNKVDCIEKGSHNILFERFYRADSSRSSQTGGSEIGLSVAKALVQAHGGRISAFSRDGSTIEFTVVL